MPDAAIEEFARKLVQNVRDAAIRSCDRQLEAGSPTPMGLRWAAVLERGIPEEIARAVVPDCVDEVLFYLLQTVDQEVLRLSYTEETGGLVDLSEAGLGELSGWYMGSGGWRAEYSQQRFVDDFADLGPDGAT